MVILTKIVLGSLSMTVEVCMKCFDIYYEEPHSVIFFPRIPYFIVKVHLESFSVYPDLFECH